MSKAKQKTIVITIGNAYFAEYEQTYIVDSGCQLTEIKKHRSPAANRLVQVIRMIFAIFLTAMVLIADLISSAVQPVSILLFIAVIAASSSQTVTDSDVLSSFFLDGPLFRFKKSYLVNNNS